MENRIEKAKEIKSNHQDEWLAHSSIVSIGIGLVDENVVGIIIGVKGKITTVKTKIPDSIDGIPIILKTVNELRAL
ncbi:MAG: hypothetical protein D8M58_01570 [Calditrichaeota bacterium]|nr:MAG: hypothetical protein DWQ03_05510 [Calditrichota bacterium]MBL1204058.1 hypothetical protein [Calditrichota bacterium]NOG43889.1 hypothetical protein [Calditrichota bacterium]